MTRFGYLVPEFPGQTHAFFWREIEALREFGNQPELVSTRAPRSGTAPHGWGKQAISQTTYLAVLSPWIVLRAIAAMWRGARSFPEVFHAIVKRLKAGESQSRLAGAKGAMYQVALTIVGAGLAELARRRQWTHIHVHSLAEAAQIALYAHLWSGIPYSLTMHGSLADYGPNQQEKWQHAEFAIVITQELLKEAQRSLAGNLPAKLAVAPMGVDVERFQRMDTYSAWNGQGPVRIFSCGRLNPSKGHDVLIRTVRLMVDHGYDVRLRIAGEDSAGQEWKERATQRRSEPVPRPIAGQ